MKTFGDPRTESVDLIDWIEMIPYTETRNYAQRVLENLSVYRIKLATEQARLAKK
jgi:soluble lytic murein transglycosylase